MSTSTKLFRFDPAGRYLGFIVVDRPLEEYAHRDDLASDQPPDAPIGYHAYRANGAWVLQQHQAPVPTLEQLKATKWAEIKAARRIAIHAPLVTPYGTFDADDEARNNIAQTAQLVQTQAQSLSPETNPTIEFTLADNSVATLTAAELVEVAVLLGQQVQAAYGRGRQVRAAINAATTAEEVEAVTWEP
jgi:hypothetical protein